jgi:hypothetical protein
MKLVIVAIVLATGPLLVMRVILAKMRKRLFCDSFRWPVPHCAIRQEFQRYVANLARQKAAQSRAIHAKNEIDKVVLRT